ncbi:putative nucleoside-diphosphate-sugar epimerase [Cladochytrium replicatum]|nr:putative nucleoside-diphosphate-sugar epimerase [Cladochytrium replicatum]
MPPQKVLLIGGTGFLGRYVAKSFIPHPQTRIAIASRAASLPSAITALGNQIVQPPPSADVTDADSILRAVEGAEVVVNMVGIMYQRGKYTFDAVQHKGAQNVAEACKKQGAKLVHVSAIGADASSSIPYARSKGLGEQAILGTLNDAVIIRPSLVFGIEDDFFNRFAKLGRILPFLPVFGGGKTSYQPVYVWDVANAITKAASATGLKKRIIEVGGPTVYSYRQLMELTLSQAGLRRPILSLPFFVGEMQGLVLEQLPPNLFTLTRDQVRLLKHDNIVHPSETVGTLADLGITNPTPAESILHTYLRKRPLVTPNKRTHRMEAQDVEEDLMAVKRVGVPAKEAKAPPPDLSAEAERHMERKPR